MQIQQTTRWRKLSSFSSKITLSSSCKLSPQKTMCMKVKPYFLGKIRNLFQTVICLNLFPACQVLNKYSSEYLTTPKACRNLLNKWKANIISPGITFEWSIAVWISLLYVLSYHKRIRFVHYGRGKVEIQFIICNHCTDRQLTYLP